VIHISVWSGLDVCLGRYKLTHTHPVVTALTAVLTCW